MRGVILTPCNYLTAHASCRILTPSDDEDEVHAGVILEGAGEEPVQVEPLTPAPHSHSYRWCR